jgi:hypothetical protein
MRRRRSGNIEDKAADVAAEWHQLGTAKAFGQPCITSKDNTEELARVEILAGQDTQLAQDGSFVGVFTTVPKSKLSAELVLELYGLRWQVELHIKRDKSIAGLDRLPNRRPDTVYTWICAKLLLVQIARKMASSRMSIPPLWTLVATPCPRLPANPLRGNGQLPQRAVDWTREPSMNHGV